MLRKIQQHTTVVFVLLSIYLVVVFTFDYTTFPPHFIYANIDINFSYIIFILFSILVLTILIYFYKRRKVMGRIELIFKTAHLEDILKYYDSAFSVSSNPEKIFLKSYSYSLVMCLYGDFENAMVLINNFNIQNFPPFFSAIEKNAIVVYNYLQKKIYRRC